MFYTLLIGSTTLVLLVWVFFAIGWIDQTEKRLQALEASKELVR